MNQDTYTGLESLRTCDSLTLRALVVELYRQGGGIATNIAEELQHELSTRKGTRHDA